LNLGIITSYYYLKYTTIELFSSSLKATTKLKGLIEILSSAHEFETIPIRHREGNILKQLAINLPMKIDKPNFNKISTKINILLQAHFSRVALPADLAADQATVLETAPRLLLAMVDVLGSSSWLAPALAAMDLAQMITQGVWDNDHDLKQLPHSTPQLVQRCKERNIDSLFDLMDLGDDERRSLLEMTNRQLSDVIALCNRYPEIDLSFEIQDSQNLHAGRPVVVNLTLERNIQDQSQLGPVYAPLLKKPKVEGWWLVIGDSERNQLVSIKRITMQQQRMTSKLDFTLPTAGDYNFMIYFVCDSYAGCDQEYPLPLRIHSPDRMDTD